MIRNRHTRFTPHCVELESRDVPAGNVTVAIIDLGYGPQLRIGGDDLANSVVLTGKGDGVVEVRGINTAVNGGSKAVTFVGVDSIEADMRGGDDTLRSSGLSFRSTNPDGFAFVGVLGGPGDDTIRLADTTAVDVSLLLSVLSDDQLDGADGNDGNDRIDITGTTVRGRGLGITAYSDGFVSGVAGQDVISITNTNYSYTSSEPGDAGGFYIQVIPGYFGPYGGSDQVTVDQFTAQASADQVFGTFELFSGWSSDQIRFSNIDIDIEARSYYSLDMVAGENYDFSGGYGGVDSLDLHNVNVTATAPLGEGSGYVSLGFGPELVNVNNVHVQTDGYLAVQLFTERADIRNVTLTSYYDAAFLAVLPAGVFGDPTAFDSTDFRLTNVNVASGQDGWVAGIYCLGDGSPNRTTLVNCSADAMGSYDPNSPAPGGNAGDDELTITNCQFNFLFLDLGDGNDTLTLQNNTFEYDFIYLGDGNDTAAVEDNTVTRELTIILGDGDDTAVVQNNTAANTIAIDGGDGTDTLIAQLNIAPLIEFDNFES